MMLYSLTNLANEKIITSPSDSNDYKFITLENGLRVIVVSDDHTDKAAVSLNVAIGSGADPKDWNGMAHFLEHMLFLGTKKYPKSGEYQAYIQQYGGHSNAYTSYDTTNYYFDINPEHLEQSLDRFSQFFIAPLFSEEFVDRERNAVDSEYSARRTNEFRRTWSARKKVFNPDHPISQFSIGNNETLKDKENQTTRDALLEFYKKYYSANIMTLAIVSDQSVDKLEQWVKTYFADIPNHDTQPFSSDKPLYKKADLPVLLESHSRKQKYTISISFALPPVKAHYKTKPLHYISNLIGHEGKSSLLSQLKTHNWAENLSSGVEINNPEAASLNISIKATRQGFENYEKVINLVLTYIELLKTKGIEQWRFDELKTLAKLDFDFMEKSEPSDYAVFLSNSIQLYPIENVISGAYLFENYDEELLRSYVNELSHENMLVNLVSPEFDSSNKTQYYFTPYTISKIDEETLNKWGNIKQDGITMSLPEKNKYIPQNTALKLSDDKDKPEKLVDTIGYKFFHHHDIDFESPRASTYINIRSPIAAKSAAIEAKNRLYTAIVSEQLNEEIYPASIAGLSMSVNSNLHGIQIRVSGFDDKQHELVEKILTQIKSSQINEKVFEQIQTKLIDKLNNKSLNSPYINLYERGSDLLVENAWPNTLIKKELKKITHSQLIEFHREFFNSIQVVALSHGNVNKDNALALSNVIKAKLLKDQALVDVASSRVVSLNADSENLINIGIEHQDAALLWIKQGKNNTFQEKANLFLLYQLIDAPFFHQLRTIEQLGYIVNVSPLVTVNHPNIIFIVQSPNTDVATIIERIKEFFITFKTQLEQTDETTFNDVKNGLILKINKKDENLEQRSNRFWQEIGRGKFEFDSRKKLTEALKNITLDQLKSVYESVLLSDDYNELLVVSKGELAFESANAPLSNYKHIIDESKFKSDGEYFD